MSGLSLLSRFVLAGAALVVGATTVGAQDEADRPNVVLILCDQFRRSTLGSMGNDQVQTPHLDTLAAESTVFRSAYCNTPLCAPSRHSLLTGLYATRLGVVHNEVAPQGEPRYLPEYLGAAGYATASIGKLHFTPSEGTHGFDFVRLHDGYLARYRSDWWPWFEREFGQRHPDRPALTWQQMPSGAAGWRTRLDGLCPINPYPTDLSPEAWVTREAIDWIDEAAATGKPFFLHASYVAPHPPYGPTREFLERYDAAELELPATWSVRRAEEFAHFSEDDFRRVLHHYYAFVSQVDHFIGELLDHLRTTGLDERTIVLFTSDHGDMLGDFGALGKGRAEEGSIGVPLMIRLPGEDAPSRSIDDPVSLIDVLPTILEAAGLEPGPELNGRSLLPYAHGANPPPRPVFCFDIRREPYLFLAAIDQDWKLSVSNSRHKRLINRRADPAELEDRSGDPDQQERVRVLTAQLLEFWQRESSYIPNPRPQPESRGRAGHEED